MFAPLLLALLLAQPEEPRRATLEGVVTYAGTLTAVRQAKVTLAPIGS